MDADGYILLGKDHGRNPYWHFPQGGVIKNESIERALAREVWEEVGLRPSDYNIVARLPGCGTNTLPTTVKSPAGLGRNKPTSRCAAKRAALKRTCTAARNSQKQNGCFSRTSSWKCSPIQKKSH